MERKIEIPFGENKIVAEIYDMDCPEFPPEITVHLQNKDGIIIQDICLVRPHYTFEKTDNRSKIHNDLLDCLVWGDVDNEDYTKKYVIQVVAEDE